MPEIRIQLPEEHLTDIVNAVAATYGGDVSVGGVRTHLIMHLRETVEGHKRHEAARATEEAFDITWADLEVVPSPEPEVGLGPPEGLPEPDRPDGGG